MAWFNPELSKKYIAPCIDELPHVTLPDLSTEFEAAGTWMRGRLPITNFHRRILRHLNFRPSLDQFRIAPDVGVPLVLCQVAAARVIG